MVGTGPLPVAGHSTSRVYWHDAFHLCLHCLLLMVVQGTAQADTCKAHKDTCAQGWHSLLQLRMPVPHGSEPGYLQRTRLPDDSWTFPELSGSLRGMPPPGSDPSLMMQMGANAHVDASASTALGMATQAEQPLQAAAQAADRAELLAVADLAQAADAERSLKGFVRKGQMAQEAQEVAMAQEESAAEAVLGAMQRVQKAGLVEKQEEAMEASASKFLQGAVESAEAMQAAEKQGGVQEVKAAQLIEEALRNLQVAGQDDPSSATFKSLKAALQAQHAVAVAKSQKLQTAALLQESLRDAVTAVQTLKNTKEVQTSDNLRKAYGDLQAVQAAWDTRTLQEVSAVQSLRGLLNDTMLVQRVADGVWANSSVRASLLQGLAREVHAAQDGVSQEAAKTQSMREALLAEAKASEAHAKKSLEDAADAALKLEASEASRRSEAAKAEQLSRYAQSAEQELQAEQLSHYVQKAQQESFAAGQQESLAAEGSRSMQAAQMSRYLQAQVAQLEQQISQINGLGKNAAPQLQSVGLPPLGLLSNGLPQVVQPSPLGSAQVAAVPSMDPRFPGMTAPTFGMTSALPYGNYAPQFGRLATGAESTMPSFGPVRVDDSFAGASFRR